MIKKLVMLILVLALVGNAFGAYSYWNTTGDSDWGTAANWGGGILPTSADNVNIRSDLGAAGYPIISTGTIAEVGDLYINPGYGAVIPSVTVDGGTLNVATYIFAGGAGGDGDFIMSSGTVNVNAAGFTSIGNNGSNGRLYMNGGTFNASFLGTPNWYDGAGSTGEIYIDGGNLNTLGFLVDVGGNIDFTKDLGDGGGLLTDIQDLDDLAWADFQAGILGNIGSGLISSSAGGGIQADFSSVGTIRTTEIYSVPEPMTMALLGVGSLMLRRRRK